MSVIEKDVLAIALSMSKPKYRSESERLWGDMYGQIYIQDVFGHPVLQQNYEPITFSIPGGVYTPDFLYILNNGNMLFVEIKGSKEQKNYRDARSKLRACAEVYYWAYWMEAVGGKKGFTTEIIGQKPNE